MKKICLGATLCAALLGPNAFAQANGFQGLSASLGLNMVDSTVEATRPGLSLQGHDADSNFLLQMQYNLALNELMVLGLGGSTQLGDLKAGNFSPTRHVKIREAYSLLVAPGYAINNTWLGYGKLAYLSASTETQGGSTRFEGGYGIGLGVQAMFGKRWFGQAEYMFQQYNDQSSAGETDRLKSNVFSLSAGYRF